MGHPTREGLPLAARPEAFAAFSGTRAKPRPGWDLPGRGFAADTALWAERANAPLRASGGDPLSRPVLAKPGFVDSPGGSAQDVRAGGSGVEPKGQPAPPQVTLLCRSSKRGASIEPSAFAQTAVIQEDEGRESVASTAQTNGIFGLLRVES